VLQCVVVCCSVLQRESCRTYEMRHGRGAAHSRCLKIVCCSLLPYVAVCCSVLQCVAVFRSVWQCVAVCGSVLQCVAVWCSVVHCVAAQGTSCI